MAGAPDDDPPGPRRDVSERSRPGPEEQVALAVEEERRAGVAGEARPEGLADERANRNGAGAVIEAVAEDRIAHRGRIAPPELPRLAAHEPPLRGQAVEPGERPEQDRARAARLRRRAGQDEAGDAVGPARRDLDRDVRAQRQPDDDRAAVGRLALDQLPDPIGRRVERERDAGRRAVAGQVRGETQEVAGQLRDLARPLRAGQPRRVDEDDRGAVVG